MGTQSSKTSASTPLADGVEGASRRDRILAAAVKEFSAKGLAGVRVDDIARRARCNKALIYYYFDGKEALYEAVFLELLGHGRPFWVQSADRSFRDWLTENWFWDKSETSEDFLRLLAMEGLADKGMGSAVQEPERAANLQRFATLLTAAQGRREVDPGMDPDLLALLLMLWSMAPLILPQITRMVTGLAVDDPVLNARLRQFNASLVDHLRMIPDEDA